MLFSCVWIVASSSPWPMTSLTPPGAIPWSPTSSTRPPTARAAGNSAQYSRRWANCAGLTFNVTCPPRPASSRTLSTLARAADGSRTDTSPTTFPANSRANSSSSPVARSASRARAVSISAMMPFARPISSRSSGRSCSLASWAACRRPSASPSARPRSSPSAYPPWSSRQRASSACSRASATMPSACLRANRIVRLALAATSSRCSGPAEGTQNSRWQPGGRRL